MNRGESLVFETLESCKGRGRMGWWIVLSSPNGDLHPSITISPTRRFGAGARDRFFFFYMVGMVFILVVLEA